MRRQNDKLRIATTIDNAIRDETIEKNTSMSLFLNVSIPMDIYMAMSLKLRKPVNDTLYNITDIMTSEVADRVTKRKKIWIRKITPSRE